MMFAFLILAALVALCNVHADDRWRDATLQPEAKGHNVVETVVNRIEYNCMFDDDRMFLRRLAYVETSDGMLHDTYPDDYHGGIWKVGLPWNILMVP